MRPGGADSSLRFLVRIGLSTRGVSAGCGENGQVASPPSCRHAGLEGCDLWKALERRGTLPIEEAVRYAVEICDALEQAHSIGIVHFGRRVDWLGTTMDCATSCWPPGCAGSSLGRSELQFGGVRHVEKAPCGDTRLRRT
jgi:hypothetical protein